MKPTAKAPLANVLDLLLDAVCMVDLDGRFVFASAACEQIFGYTPEEMAGRSMIEMVHPLDRERTLASAAEVIAGTAEPHFENRYLRKDGRIVHVMWSARWSEADQMRIGVARDITERKRADAMRAALYAISEAAHSAEDLLALFGHIHQIVGELLPAINFFVALYDGARDELSFPYHVDQHDQAPAPRRLNSGTLSGEVIRTGRALLVTPDTRVLLPDGVAPSVGTDPLDWLGVPLISQQRVLGALVVQSYSGDVRYTEEDKELLQFVSTQVAAAIERKQTHTRLQHLAQHDALTGLPNRELFHDRLQTALARARREHSRLALLYIDLDRFKQVNDALGHAAGDLLLREVGLRLRQCVRESDTIGRIGGDEFLVLLPTIDQPADAARVAAKIRHALNRPFELDGELASISSSIGIAVCPEHGDGKQELIQRADRAMYAAKQRGGDQSVLATATRDARDDDPVAVF
jgi:diguanylate cyclase (GGDEF)-like protein/PAS domain S-box-containing protein